MRGNELTEVEQDKPRKDLLADEFRLFRMKSIQADRILQLPERRLNAPPQMIKFLECSSREFIFKEIRHQILVGIIRKADTDDSKSQIVKLLAIQVTKVEAVVLWKEAVSLRICLHQSFDFFRLLFCQRNSHSSVKFPAFRKIKLGKNPSGG